MPQINNLAVGVAGFDPLVSECRIELSVGRKSHEEFRAFKDRTADNQFSVRLQQRAFDLWLMDAQAHRHFAVVAKSWIIATGRRQAHHADQLSRIGDRRAEILADDDRAIGGDIDANGI